MGLFGDWDKAAEITGSMHERFERASHQAMLAEGHYLRGQVVKGLREQAPGGDAFKPLSPLTIAIRSFAGFAGTKALIRRGDLRNMIVVKSMPAEKAVFVGVLRTAVSKDGHSVINVAEMNENGAGPIVIPITPKSRKFFHAALAHAGFSLVPGHGHGGGGMSVAIVRIPARPMFRPVFEHDAKPDAVRKRFYAHVARAMAGDLGKL
jgi:hypothetical protein